MEKISKIIFFFLTYIVISCSSSEDNSPSEITDSNTINSLELYMSSDEVTIGTTVLFTAFDNNGKNRTTDVKFYVDDNEIQEVLMFLMIQVNLTYMQNIKNKKSNSTIDC